MKKGRSGVPNSSAASTITKVRVYPREYIDPGQAESVNCYNCRVFFLVCIERLTPEVVEDLARNVLPLYEKQFWADSEKRGVANTHMDNWGYHEKVARVWCRGLRNSHWWDFYALVRDPLLTWANRYSLRVEWVVHLALDSLLKWSREFKRFAKFEKLLTQSEIDKYVQRLKPGDRQAFLAEQRRHEARVREAMVSWPLQPLIPDQPIPRDATTQERQFQEELRRNSMRSFQYRRWDGFDVDRYRRWVLDTFEAHLDKYLDEEIKPKVTSMQPVLAIRPERFEALALHVCRRMSAKEIARSKLIPQYWKHHSVISKDIASAAKVIDFGKLPSPRRRTRLTSSHVRSP